jgi:hypothetical protein
MPARPERLTKIGPFQAPKRVVLITLLTANNPSLFSKSPERNFDLWYKGVAEYSARDLTRSNEPPAISGYAHEMS